MLHSSRRHLEIILRDAQGNQIARCLVRRGRYIIGSDPHNEVVVDEQSVSSKHARLTVIDDEHFLIKDLESANGTFLDDVPVSGEVALTLDNRLQFGLCTLEFQRAGLPAAVFNCLPDGFLREERYNFGEAVVQGRTSTIFEAYDRTLGRDVAVKVMRPESQGDREQVLRFIREAQIASQLQHPGILTVYNLGMNEQSQLYYTTRFVEGDSLAALLDQLSAGDQRVLARHSLATLITAFQKACDALAYAHSRGVIHAGLRPESITLGRFGETMVVNWSFARMQQSHGASDSFPHPVIAAPAEQEPPLSAYLAPELLAGDWSRATPRSDIYALGAILYGLLTLRAPFTASDDDELLHLIAGGDISFPAEDGSGSFAHCPHGRIPKPLATVALKAMSLDPNERFSTVQELQQAVFNCG